VTGYSSRQSAVGRQQYRLGFQAKVDASIYRMNKHPL